MIIYRIVVELLVRFHNQHDWEHAIQEGVPLRKQDNQENQENSDGDDNTTVEYTCFFKQTIIHLIEIRIIFLEIHCKSGSLLHIKRKSIFEMNILLI